MSRVETANSPPDTYTMSQPTPVQLPGRPMQQHPSGMPDFQSSAYTRQHFAPHPGYAPGQHMHHIGPMQQAQSPSPYFMAMPSHQGAMGDQGYSAQDMAMVPHSTLAELTHHSSTAAMAVPPRQPTAIHVQLPPDLPEDGPQSGRCLQDLISLREEWQLLSKRQLSSDQAESEAKPLIGRTTHVVGTASQSAITRQEMYDLLVFAAEVLRACEQSQSAATFARLADNVALACPTRSSLITNIMHGGHQTLTGGKQMVSAKPTTHVQAVLGAKAQSDSNAKSLAQSLIHQVKQQNGILQLVGAAAAGLVALGIAGKVVRASRGFHHSHRGNGGGFGGTYGGSDKRTRALYERRRMQCESSNKEAHEYLRKVHANRWNLLWREPPPHNSCIMPHDNLPWSPHEFASW